MKKRGLLDKLTGKIKCPSITCRSADIQVIGRTLFLGRKKYQCRKCGRVFK